MESGDSLIFICSTCGKLGLINNVTWSDPCRSKPAAPVPTPDVVDLITDLSTWEHASEFQALVELTKYEHIPSFPLCEHCAELATEHAIRMNKLMADFVVNVKVLGDSPQFSMAPEPLTPFAPRAIEKPREVAEKKPPASAPPEAPTPTEVPPVQRSLNSRYAQLAAFRLSMTGPFATINGLRLGRLRDLNVPQYEVQNGLLLLCRLLVYQMRIIGMDSPDIRIGAAIHFAAGKNFYELRFPTRSKDDDKFNQALCQMMGQFDAVFVSDQMKKTRPSNLIDLPKKTIAGESFLYSKPEPGNFTRAMRKLIVNLKTIQAYQTIFGT
jgi:hypothetical protein